MFWGEGARERDSPLAGSLPENASCVHMCAAVICIWLKDTHGRDWSLVFLVLCAVRGGCCWPPCVRKHASSDISQKESSRTGMLSSDCVLWNVPLSLCGLRALCCGGLVMMMASSARPFWEQRENPLRLGYPLSHFRSPCVQGSLEVHGNAVIHNLEDSFLFAPISASLL